MIDLPVHSIGLSPIMITWSSTPLDADLNLNLAGMMTNDFGPPPACSEFLICNNKTRFTKDHGIGLAESCCC